jgi:NADPH-dependent 2,4-dienoyl-CoA reductase/sulfur reductase-like enzyme
MVLIHGGHGWFLSQFLSPLLNTRKDRWGGSLENRMRLPLAIIENIRKKCGPRFPIEFRMSVSEGNEQGYGPEEGVRIAKKLDGKVDLIHASAGNHEVRDAFVVTHPSLFMPDGVNAWLAAEVKKNVKTPVATVGAFTEPELMEEILATGKADVVEVARGLISDPDLPAKARAGKTDDITRCLRCFTCFSYLLTNQQLCCAVNPEIGAEYETKFMIPPPAASKKVLVAGGGIGGMQAALTAAARGHQVILAEKTNRLGGVLRCEENVPFKDHLDAYLNQQERRVRENPAIELRLCQEVTPAFVREIDPEVVIAALGARPVKPPIPGIDGENVLGAEDAYLHPEKTGAKVVILGAGFVGTELGLYLKGLGKEVEILEMLPEINHAGNMLHGLAVDVRLREVGVPVHYSTKAAEITKKGVVGETADGKKKKYDADTVLYAVGQQPLWDEAEALSATAPEFYQIGDCVSPKNIREATKSAYFIASNIGRV